ncbi:MAG: hypothetical protein ACUVTP_02745, partial [Candidatus Fervidibacter sp.]
VLIWLALNWEKFRPRPPQTAETTSHAPSIPEPSPPRFPLMETPDPISILNEALQVAKSIDDAVLRLEALRYVASEMAKAGQFEQALQIAKNIKYADERLEALNAVAVEMVKEGMKEQAKSVFQQALQTAKSIEDAWERSEALVKLAVAMLGKEQHLPRISL